MSFEEEFDGTYIGNSSLFGSGLKNDKTRSWVTSSMRDGFHFGLLSLLINNARTPDISERIRIETKLEE